MITEAILTKPNDHEIIDAVGALRTNEKLRIHCKSTAQWHDMKAIIKAEFPETYFRIRQINDDGKLILKIKVL